MIVVPGVIKAAAHARCIELLEGGTFIFPETGEGVMVMFTLKSYKLSVISYESKRLKNISRKSVKLIFLIDAFPILSSTTKFISLPDFFLSCKRIFHVASLSKSKATGK